MGRLTAAEKVRRDQKIAADRARGLRWATIAQKHSVSERHARDIWKERLAAEPPEHLDGHDALAEALLQVEAAIEDLALLAQSTNNDPVRLGAIRARLAAMAQRHDLLRLAGYLPYRPRDSYVEADLHRMGADLVEVLARHDVSDGLLDDLIDALDTPLARVNGRDG